MLRSKCATLVLRGGGTSVGVVWCQFFQGSRHLLAWSTSANFCKSGQKSFFLRNGAIFGVVRRKNRSFCGVRGANCVKFSANF